MHARHMAAINNAAVGGTPSLGLVIGNSRYPYNALKNPSNDVTAIADSCWDLDLT